MTEYIPKSALVAEIERIEHETNYEPFTDEVLGKRCTCRSLLSFINTIEVKEVEEPVSEDLEEAAFDYAEACKYDGGEKLLFVEHFKAGAEWKKEQFEKDYTNLCNGIATIKGLAVAMAYDKGVAETKDQMMKNIWKDAQGDDLPEIDREVIALLDNGKVVFAHRPYKGKYIGKNLTTGNIETFENKTYDKGEWNQPNVKWWLDIEKLPNIN